MFLNSVTYVTCPYVRRSAWGLSFFCHLQPRQTPLGVQNGGQPSVNCRYRPEGFQGKSPCVGMSPSWVLTVATAMGIGSLALADSGRPGSQIAHSPAQMAALSHPAAEAWILGMVRRGH